MYSGFTMLCLFQVYGKVIQFYIHIFNMCVYICAIYVGHNFPSNE